jgi:tetratricopeptide (TPR) repeat protein
MTVCRWIQFAPVILLVSSCYADERFPQVNEWFESGNKCYSKGEYKGAIEYYEKIAVAGFVNETVYYNLANAFYRNNQIGKAILFYEKARRFAPHDPEVLGNLSMVGSRIADKVEAAYEPLWLRQLHRFRGFFSLDSETGFALVLYLAANFIFSIYVLAGKERTRQYAFHTSLILGVLFLVVGTSNAIRIYESQSNLDGVVVVEKVDVLSGPGTENPTLFSIHEGLKVRVQHELGEWLLISLDNGWSGWVQKAVLGII